MDLQKLLETGECEWIDFKVQHHENRADLVHDVLCLANASHDGDRYLVYGVADDLTVAGIQAGQVRRSQADLINFLQSLRFNQPPHVTLFTVTHAGVEVDVLQIKKLPERPYFLLQEYPDGRERVRAGAVYTRVGDTNTPKDRTADDIKVEHMYRERFGLDLAPSERVRIYLRDVDNWRYDHGEMNKQFFLYEPFPEFTLVEAEQENGQPFDDPWVRVFPDPNATMDLYYIKYHGTILAKVRMVWCDGARYLTVLPKSWSTGVEDEGRVTSYYFVDGSTSALVNEMVQRVYPVESRHYLERGFSSFGSEDAAREALARDWDDGRRHTYYRYDQEARTYHQVRGGQEHVLLDRTRR